MTHPKARTKPRRRERRDPQDRIILTAKGRALLAAFDARERRLAPAHYATGDLADYCARCACLWHHCQCDSGPTTDDEHGRATPCAPNRGNDASAPLPAHDAGTADAPPAHPAGKSGAAALVKPTNGDPND